MSGKETTGEKRTKSGLFIFWIDRSDGMEPCVRMKAAVLLARTFLALVSAHMLLIPSYTMYMYTHTHGTHGGKGIFMDR